MNNYCDAINLEMYNLFNKYDDITMKYFLKECSLVMQEANSIVNIKPLLEAEGEEKQNVIAQIIAFFSKLWEAFLGKVIGFEKRDKGFLQDPTNKSIILNKPFKEEFNFTMYNFPQGETLIANTTLPDMNYMAMKDKLTDEATFGKAYFANIMKAGGNTPEGGKVKIQDLARAYFRGSNEPIQIKASQLDKKGMYNFCVNYGAFANKIKADTARLKDAANEYLNREKKAAREKISESDDLFGKNYYLSAIYESFILEADENGDNNTNNTSTTPQRNDANTNNTTNNNQQQNNSTTPNNNDSAKDQKKQVNNELKEMTKKIKLYIKVCGAIFGAKLQVGEEIYKAYIDILKAHVKDYKGEDNNQQNGDQNNNNNQANNNTDSQSTINNAFK